MSVLRRPGNAKHPKNMNIDGQFSRDFGHFLHISPIASQFEMLWSTGKSKNYVLAKRQCPAVFQLGGSPRPAPQSPILKILVRGNHASLTAAQ